MFYSAQLKISQFIDILRNIPRDTSYEVSTQYTKRRENIIYIYIYIVQSRIFEKKYG